jgi:tetratricopeptide (TPR) repeat protein/tRNA A-37 threonylcarbamoyl transferase component Bud32
MGEVYRAECSEVLDVVALKTIRAEWRDNESVVERFRSEIRLARRIAHPNICPIFDIFPVEHPRGGKLVFFTMKYLDGDTLAERMRGGALDRAETLRLAEGIGAGLDAAHGEGVIHRDLKPGNIILVKERAGGERPVITDFGLAKIDAAGLGEETAHNQVLGSPAYMAPEQFLGDHVTAAADIYAFALIFYEMVSGKRPLSDDSVLSLAIKRWTTDAPLLSAMASGAPRNWDAVMARALARDPRRRPASASILVEELKRAPRGLRRLGPQPDWRNLSRRTWIGMGAGTMAAGVVATFLSLSRYIGKGVAIPDAPVLMLTACQHDPDPHDSELAAAIDALMANQLQQSAHIRLLSEGQIARGLSLIRNAGDAKAALSDARTARDVAMRQGANWIMFAALSKLGDAYTYRTRMELLGSSPDRERDSSNDEMSFRDAERSWDSGKVHRIADIPDLPRGIHRQAERIRSKLGEQQEQWSVRSRTPEELTTTSWEALQYYLQGDAKWRSAHDPDAIELLRSALRADPAFALAQGRLADILMATGQRDAAIEAHGKAVELVQRKHLTDPESLRIQGLFAADIGDYRQSASIFQEYRKEFPRDPLPYFYESQAVRRLGNADYGAKLLDGALAIDPGSYAFTVAKAIYLIEDGKLDAAEKETAAADRIQARGSMTHRLRAAIAVGRLDIPEASRQLEQMRGSADPVLAGIGFQLGACLLAERGHYAEAEAMVHERIRLVRSDGLPAEEAIDSELLLAQLSLNQGRGADAIRTCRQLLERGPGKEVTLRLGCIVAEAAAGEPPAERAATLSFVRKRCIAPESAWPIYQHWTRRLRGDMALAEGKPRLALKEMAAVPLPTLDNVWPDYLARTAVAAGDFTTARPLFQNLFNNPARYLLAANRVGPGFIRWAVQCAGDNPALATDAKQFRALCEALEITT